MQKQLIEVIKGSHKGYKCNISLKLNDIEINPTDKVWKRNYYGTLTQYILSGVKNNTIFEFSILDPTKKGPDALTSFSVVYNDSFKFCRIAYKDNDLFSFYGCFKLISPSADLKEKLKYTTAI